MRSASHSSWKMFQAPAELSPPRWLLRPRPMVTCFCSETRAQRQSTWRSILRCPGPGSIHHLTMAIFADRAGIELQHVPYRGGSALVNGLLTGEIQAGWSGIPNVLPLIQSGSLRVFCISTIARSKSMPDLPTCAELGYAGFDVASMIGLQTSAGAPREVIAVIQSAIAKALRHPEITDRMKVLGMEIQENGTQHYTQFMKDDIERYEKAVKQLGIQTK